MADKLKIVMLGSRGVGKTSTLSAMWHELANASVNDDEVSFTPKDDTLKTLDDKWTNVLSALADNRPFISIDVATVGPDGTAGFINHEFTFKAGKGNKCDITFIDSAGGFTEDLNPDLVKEVNEALGIFFVVDAAKLMECDAAINHKANNPMILRQIITKVTEDDDKHQPSFVMFVLTKCETYMGSLADQKKLFEKFSEHFGGVISYIKLKGMKVYYLPIQTMGCVVFRRMTRDGSLEFKKCGSEIKPVDALYPLKLVFEHLIAEMAKKQSRWYKKILQWLGLQDDVKKYYKNLERIAPKPLDFRKL